MTISATTKELFKSVVTDVNTIKLCLLEENYHYNTLEIRKHITKLNTQLSIDSIVELLKKSIGKMVKSQIVTLVECINKVIKSEKLSVSKLVITGKKISEIKTILKDFVDTHKSLIDVVNWRRIYYMDNHILKSKRKNY